MHPYNGILVTALCCRLAVGQEEDEEDSWAGYGEYTEFQYEQLDTKEFYPDYVMPEYTEYTEHTDYNHQADQLQLEHIKEVRKHSLTHTQKTKINLIKPALKYLDIWNNVQFVEFFFWRRSLTLSQNGSKTDEFEIVWQWDDASWIFCAVFMVFTMQTGFAMLEAGCVSLKGGQLLSVTWQHFCQNRCYSSKNDF